MVQRVLSGIRPTGMLHLGNYYGAIKQFIKLQQTYKECLFFVADLHALTTHAGSTEIHKNSLAVVKGFLACGLDPKKSIIYKQSAIPKIPYLNLILGMLISESWLRKCTTYKEKISKKQMPTFGLLGYPVLMAADILSLRANIVPVGHDQLQHLEMTRDIALKFNSLYGEIFDLPTALELSSIRVPGLDGTGKMGKSDNNYIGLFEEDKIIKKKIMRATTDSGPTDNKMSKAVSNIYYLLKLCCPPEVYQKYINLYNEQTRNFYGDLKKDLAKYVIEKLTPFREKYQALKDSDCIDILNQGAKKANILAEETFELVWQKLNL